MIYYEGNKNLISTACGVGVNDEYILWSSWENRSLSKLYLEDKHVEYVKNMSKIDFAGQRIANMLKHDNKIYLISLWDAYEIFEYDIESDELRQVYSKAQKGIYSFKAFFLDEKIYIFPFQLDASICIYSIMNNKADYIKWETLLQGIRYDIKTDGVFSMDCLGDFIYGVIYNTPYIFEIKVKPQVECRVDKIDNEYKLAAIAIYSGMKYITLADENMLLCIKPNGKIEKFELKYEERQKNEIVFWEIIAREDKVFLLPNGDHDNIQVVNTLIGKSELLKLPDRLNRTNQERLFWAYCIAGNEAYLLPHTADGLVVLDMCNCKMDYYSDWKFKLRDFLKTELYEEIEKKVEKEKKKHTVGEVIYKMIQE